MIIGGKISKVTVERLTDEPVKGFNVSVDVRNMTAKDKFVLIDYHYELEYKDKVGTLAFEGQVIFQGDDKQRKDILDKWAKTKELDPAFAEEVLNSITHTGRVLGTLYAFSIGLPAPIEANRYQLQRNAQASGKKAG